MRSKISTSQIQHLKGSSHEFLMAGVKTMCISISMTQNLHSIKFVVIFKPTQQEKILIELLVINESPFILPPNRINIIVTCGHILKSPFWNLKFIAARVSQQGKYYLLLAKNYYYITNGCIPGKTASTKQRRYSMYYLLHLTYCSLSTQSRRL